MKNDNYKKQSIERNKKNRFLQESTIRIRGSQALNNLEDLEEITKTRHPSIENSYKQKIKEKIYSEGRENYKKGIQNLEKNLEFMKNKKLTKFIFKTNTRYDLSILKHDDTIIIAKYHHKDTKKNKRQAIKSLTEMQNSIEYQHKKTNIEMYYGTGDLIVNKLTDNGFIPFNYSKNK